MIVRYLRFAIPRASARGKSSAPHQPALAEKPGEAKPGQFSGLPVLTFDGLRFIFRRLLG